jgi:hypothetical protein
MRDGPAQEIRPDLPLPGTRSGASGYRESLPIAIAVERWARASAEAGALTEPWPPMRSLALSRCTPHRTPWTRLRASQALPQAQAHVAIAPKRERYQRESPTVAHDYP